MRLDLSKRLYLSRRENSIAGVCGGIAEWLEIDPTIVRLIFVALAVAGGPGLLIYIVLWIVIPEEPEFIETSAEKVKRDEMA